MTDFLAVADGAEAITDEELLLRRVHPKQIKADGNLTTAAFNDRQMSVHREKLRSKTDIQRAFPQHSIAEFIAREARNVGNVEPDPLPDDISHALVLCRDSTQSGLDRFAKALKRVAQARWNPQEHVSAGPIDG